MPCPAANAENTVCETLLAHEAAAAAPVELTMSSAPSPRLVAESRRPRTQFEPPASLRYGSHEVKSHRSSRTHLPVADINCGSGAIREGAMINSDWSLRLSRRSSSRTHHEGRGRYRQRSRRSGPVSAPRGSRSGECLTPRTVVERSWRQEVVSVDHAGLRWPRRKRNLLRVPQPGKPVSQAIA